MHTTRVAVALALDSAGSKSAARMTMMAITTNNSIKVNPAPGCLRPRLNGKPLFGLASKNFAMAARNSNSFSYRTPQLIAASVGSKTQIHGERFRFQGDNSQLHTLLRRRSPQGFRDRAGGPSSAQAQRASFPPPRNSHPGGRSCASRFPYAVPPPQAFQILRACRSNPSSQHCRQ